MSSDFLRNQGFGATLNAEINKARECIKRANFTSSVSSAISDGLHSSKLQLKILELSCINEINKVISEREWLDLGQPPEIEPNTDEPNFEDIDIDALIIESYAAGKSDIEIASDFMSDFKSILEMYAYLFIAIGIQVRTHEESKRIANLNARIKYMNDMSSTR